MHQTYRSEDQASSLDADGFDVLEEVHFAFGLEPLDLGVDRDESTSPSNSIATAQKDELIDEGIPQGRGELDLGN